MFVVLTIVNFIVLVLIVRFVVEKIMGFLGASMFFFNPISRAVTCLILALILAALGI